MREGVRLPSREFWGQVVQDCGRKATRVRQEIAMDLSRLDEWRDRVTSTVATEWEKALAGAGEPHFQVTNLRQILAAPLSVQDSVGSSMAVAYILEQSEGNRTALVQDHPDGEVAVEEVHPHVVVQISIGNHEDYDVDAINDIMNHADAAQRSARNRGILIKCRAADATNGMQPGWDVYSIPRGATFQDAVNNTNQAHHVVYNYGGADVDLVITEADLGGFKFDFWGTVRNFFARSNRNTNFSISLAELYDVAV